MDSTFFPSAALSIAHFYIMQPNSRAGQRLDTCAESKPAFRIYALSRPRVHVCRWLPNSVPQSFLIPLFAVSTFASVVAVAQPPARFTVDEVIQKLQANLDSYDTSIPSFVADEYIDSFKHEFAARGASPAGNTETIAESVFRLQKEIDAETNTYTLGESREVKTIDGRPARGRGISAAFMISGAFSGGLAFVAEDQRPCRTFTLEKIKPGKPVVVHFQTAANIPDPKVCILDEVSSGRVSINPASMQIQRLELDVPRHFFTPFLEDGSRARRTMGQWKVVVNYKPVVLNAKTFWLPATILSTCSNEQTEWSFSASYRNYHLLEVHSQIVIPGER